MLHRGLIFTLLACLVIAAAAARQAPRRIGGGAPPTPVVLHNYIVGSPLGFSDQVQKFDVDGNGIDGGNVGVLGSYARFGSVFYSYGAGQFCGSPWGIPKPPAVALCGFPVYKSIDHINWQRLGVIIDPTTYPCGGLDYECWPYAMFYDAANSRYVFWAASNSAAHTYMVWYCTTPAGLADGGSCARQSDPNTTCGQGGPYTGSAQAFVDDDGIAYFKCDYNRGISIQQLNSTFSDVVGSPTLFSAGYGEGGGMFKWTDGKYYATVGPNCAGCTTGSPGELWQATAPLGPYTDTGVAVNVDSSACQGQTGSFESFHTNAGLVVLAHPTQNLGTSVQAAENDYVGLVRTVGGLPRFPCEATTTIPGLSTAGPPSPPPGIDQSSENGYFNATAGGLVGDTHGVSSSFWWLQTFTPTASTISKVEFTTAQSNPANPGYPPPSSVPGPDNDLVLSLVNVNQSTHVPTGTIVSVTVPRSTISWLVTRVTATFNQSVTPGTIYGIQVSGLNTPGAGVYMVEQDFNNPYPGGKALQSANSGSTWTAPGSGLYDLRFREFQ